MLDRCATILGTLCESRGGSVLLECSGEADHVHALIDLPPKVRPSDLINLLKTVTSRRLRSEFPSLRAAYRGKPVLWSPSYCLISAGGAPILREYVRSRRLRPLSSSVPWWTPACGARRRLAVVRSRCWTRDARPPTARLPLGTPTSNRSFRLRFREPVSQTFWNWRPRASGQGEGRRPITEQS